MRKMLVSGCLAVALLVLTTAAQTAKADHGYGYGNGYASGFGAPSCHNHAAQHRSHYDGYAHYQTAIIPVYPGGIYQSYSFGGSPFGGYSNFGQIGSNFGAGQYGAGYGGSNFYGSGYRKTVPRVQLRVGF